MAGRFGFIVDLITGKATAAAKKLSSAIGKQGKVAQKTGSAVGSLAKKYLAVGAIAFAAQRGLTSFTRTIFEQQAALKDTLTLIPRTTKGFAEMEKTLRNKARSLSTALGVSGTEINKGFYQVISTGAEAGT